MVKGVTRRVIVVKTPDPRYFEEAIFIVKEDASIGGADVDQVLQEAQAVANSYVKHNVYKQGILAKIPPLGYLIVGALLSAGAFGLTHWLL